MQERKKIECFEKIQGEQKLVDFLETNIDFCHFLLNLIKERGWGYQVKFKTLTGAVRTILRLKII